MLDIDQSYEEIIGSLLILFFIFFLLKILLKNFQKFVTSLAIIFDTWNFFYDILAC